MGNFDVWPNALVFLWRRRHLESFLVVSHQSLVRTEQGYTFLATLGPQLTTFGEYAHSGLWSVDISENARIVPEHTFHSIFAATLLHNAIKLDSSGTQAPH